MNITKHTDYSFKILMYLALKPGQSYTISQLSTVFNVSKNHLMKVVNNLSTAGFLHTQRGRGGGIRLGKPIKSIRIGAVVEAMEFSLEIVDCNANGGCLFQSACKLKGMFTEATRSFIHTLDNYTLADLVERPEKFIKLID